PLRVGGRASPTSLGFVDDIVVNQRGGMDDFNYCTEADRAASFIVEQFRGEKEQGRSNSFASAGPKIFANFGNGTDVGDRVAPELVLECHEIVPQEIEDFFTVDGCWRAHLVLSTQYSVPSSKRYRRFCTNWVLSTGYWV